MAENNSVIKNKTEILLQTFLYRSYSKDCLHSQVDINSYSYGVTMLSLHIVTYLSIYI